VVNFIAPFFVLTHFVYIRSTLINLELVLTFLFSRRRVTSRDPRFDVPSLLLTGLDHSKRRHHVDMRNRARDGNRVITCKAYSYPPRMPPSSSRFTPPPKTRPPTSLASRARPRKPQTSILSQTINTSVSAHPRTDPVGALNVLLKLFTSLPSRIGGCQYKLTQAEHALSLYLISILDPFVYHGARALVPKPVSSAPRTSPFGLVDQPTEIIDAILFHVDSRKDLLNIGLGCKRLYDIVFPRHYDYRVIRCKVSSISVWNHLVHHRSLARNVRKLEILDERASSRQRNPVCVPRGILQGDTDLESTDDELSMHAKQERFLAAALVRMTGLKEFKWSCNHSPISIAHIWPTLMMRAVNLNSMDICDNLIFSPKAVQDDDEDSGTESESEGEAGRTMNGRCLMASVPTSTVGYFSPSASALD